MTHAIRLFHIRIDLDLHGSSSHISHISLKYYDLSLIDRMLELKIVHCRSYHPICLRMTHSYHSGNLIQPLHQCSAKKSSASVQMLLHDQMNLLRHRCFYRFFTSFLYLCHFSFPAFYHTFTFSVETSRSIKIFYLKVSLRFSSLILLCNILALVIKLFTTCHANLYFYQAVLEINLQWYQSQSFFL